MLLFGAVMFAFGEGEYIIGTLRPGDVLHVSVFGTSEFNTKVRIEESGYISFPQCGLVKAAGRTSREIADDLALALKNVIADPYVDVFVESWGPRTVFVLGEVMHSGISLELPTYIRITALQAISSAGGFTQSADLSKVCVLRRDPETMKLVRHNIDVSALTADEQIGEEFILAPEDTIIVPKAPPVHISGMVKNPSEYYIDTQRLPHLSEILTRAGGVSNGADVDAITIIRKDAATGHQEVLVASLSDIEQGNFKNDIVILPGDHIMVREAYIYVLGQVHSPGPLHVMPSVRLTATRAIALAGGFTKIADRTEVRLFRNNQVTVLNLKKIYNDEQTLVQDVELRCGDILFVTESWF